MVAGLAALGPGGLGPGIRRIGVPFGPTIVVARLPLWKTVQGGGQRFGVLHYGSLRFGGSLVPWGLGPAGSWFVRYSLFRGQGFLALGLVPGAF